MGNLTYFLDGQVGRNIPNDDSHKYETSPSVYNLLIYLEISHHIVGERIADVSSELG